MILVKVTIDKRTQGMVQHFMNNGRKLRVHGALTPRVEQMKQLGEYAVNLIKNRVFFGKGSDDAPMKPLSTKKATRWSKKQGKYVEYGDWGGYAGFKRRHGGRPLRDLSGPGAKGSGPWARGHMLDSLSLRSVSEREARIDITTAWGRGKARANEIRSPWFGWSPNDLKSIVSAAEAMFRSKVADIAVMFGLQGQLGQKPIWMNPWAAIAPHSADARWASALRSRIESGSLNRRRAVGVSHPERRRSN